MGEVPFARRLRRHTRAGRPAGRALPARYGGAALHPHGGAAPAPHGGHLLQLRRARQVRLPRHAQRRHKPGGRGLRPGRERGLPQKDAQGAQAAHPPGPCQAGAQREDRGRLPRIPEKASPRHGRADILHQRAALPQLRLFPCGPAAGGAAPLADLSGVPALPLLRAEQLREHDKADHALRPAAQLSV